MNERSIFTEALERDDAAERAAFLDEACAGDAALRQRVEALLGSHAGAGDFLGKPAPQRLAEEFASGAETEATQGEPAAEGGAADELRFLTPSDRPDSLGRLGHYDVLEVVGRGGMGVVLRAFDAKLHRVAAVKVMAPQLAASAAARKRFAREAQAQAAVSHDHVVPILAVDEADGLPYLVMQYVAGASLQERLGRGGPLELHEVLRIGMQTAAGLAAAHAQGLIHRDVKPANILLENGVQRVKLTDFGLARAADDASVTQSGVVAGTPHYMSPEQARGEAVDARSDLFSLGSVLYAMCTGRPPFRASGSMAVLRRVCDEAPTPVQEANPAVPDWLAAIIERLHAKDPAGRYQSATEVAELLGQCLAHVQQPSVVASPLLHRGTEVGGEGGGRRRRGRRWLAAAAVALCLLGGLSLAEATGVTHVAATVVRIFTPEGTLVVESDDPAVKVTVEGDGDVVISGAGPQEVRLKSGSYRLRAAKDGQAVKLDRDLVTITRGDTQVVRVRLEGEAPAAAPAKTEQGAFVLMAGDGVAERKFATLADAVGAAESGDAIEIRGDGPFETDGAVVTNPALVIRAGPGCRPVLSLSAKGRAEDRPIVRSFVPALALEGLTLQRMGSSASAGAMIQTNGSALRVANCRFVVKDNNAVAIWAHLSPRVDVRNCAFLGSRAAVVWPNPKEATLSVDNCQLATDTGVAFEHGQQVQRIDVRLTRNTFAVGDAVRLEIRAVPDFFTAGSRPDARRFRVQVENNVFAVTECTFSVPQVAEAWRDKPVAAGPFKTLAQDLVAWREERNLYPSNVPFMASIRPGGPYEPLVGPDQLAEWRKFAGPDAGALRGQALFAGGNVLAQAQPNATPERLLPKHFRLLPQSAGCQAGKDGRDLGADVELVGPGEAYERWKKTPEYQQWLKDTGQKK